MNGNIKDAISRKAAIDIVMDEFRRTPINAGERAKVRLEALSSVQPEYKLVSIEEVAAELGASTIHTALYFSYCLQMLDFLGFSICKKEVNKGEPSGLIESADIKPFNNPCDSCDDKSGCSRCSFF